MLLCVQLHRKINLKIDLISESVAIIFTNANRVAKLLVEIHSEKLGFVFYQKYQPLIHRLRTCIFLNILKGQESEMFSCPHHFV
jgi:hypothetical protein